MCTTTKIEVEMLLGKVVTFFYCYQTLSITLLSTTWCLYEITAVSSWYDLFCHFLLTLLIITLLCLSSLSTKWLIYLLWYNLHINTLSSVKFMVNISYSSPLVWIVSWLEVKVTVLKYYVLLSNQVYRAFLRVLFSIYV